MFSTPSMVRSPVLGGVTANSTGFSSSSFFSSLPINSFIVLLLSLVVPPSIVCFFRLF